MAMTKEFNHNGHKYNVVPVENSDEFVIIRDNRRTSRVNKDVAENAVKYVDKLFS